MTPGAPSAEWSIGIDPLVGAVSGWGAALLAVAVAYLVFQTWRGWKLGVVRAGISLLAIVGAGLLGWYGGMALAGLLGAILPVSTGFLWLVCGLALALAFYIALLVISAVLFKKTGHQSSGLVRIFFGLGGAACGLLVGLVVVWAAFSGVRALGRISEARAQEPGGIGNLARQLAGARDSLEEGAAGRIVRSADPVPDSLYETVGKVARVTGDEAALARLLEYPDFQEVLVHPLLVELASDPAIQRAAENQNYFALLANPKVLRAATDPALAALLRQVDLQKALDYALEKPSTPAAESPNIPSR